MKSARLLPLLPLLFASCGVAHHWRELQTAPMSMAECYDGLVYIATTGGYVPDEAECDRGLGTWQSRWKERQLALFGLGRFRLRAEVLLDEGSREDGWIVRYYVEQQIVEDPRRRRDPRPEDWEDEGQDAEAEAIFADRLARRLAPRP